MTLRTSAAPVAEHEDQADDHVEERAGHDGGVDAAETRSQALVEATHRVRVGAARLEIGQADEPLFDKARQVGRACRASRERTATKPPPRVMKTKRRQREQRHQCADAPVLAEQQHEDAEQEHAAAEHLHHKAREEVRDGRDVAVDTLDQLAGGVLGVERIVELEDVAREVGAQRVGRAPAEVLGHVRLGDARRLA